MCRNIAFLPLLALIAAPAAAQTIPNSPLLGGNGSAFTSVAPDGTTLTLSSGILRAHVGTTAGTVAAGNDSRLVGAFQATGGTITGATTFSATGNAVSVPNGSATVGPGTQAGAQGSFSALSPSTYGSFWTAATGSFMANRASAKPQVSGFSAPSQVASYAGRDSVALFASNEDRAPLLTLTGATFSTTAVCPSGGLTPAQVASIRIGAFVETNPSPTKYTGTITAANTSCITVGGGWFQSGDTASGQVPPAGSTAYVDVVTSPFAANFVATYTNAYPQNGIGPVGLEVDQQVYNPTFVAGNLFTEAGDTPVSNAVQVVSQKGTAGAGITIDGPFDRGILIRNAVSYGFVYGGTSGTGFVTGQGSGAFFSARSVPSDGSSLVPTLELQYPSTVALGRQSGGIGATVPQLNFYSSANNVIDSQLAGSGGGTSAYGGILNFTGTEFRIFSPAGSSGEYMWLLAQNGTGSVIAAQSNDSTNSFMQIKSKGIDPVVLSGNTDPYDAPIALFYPPSVSGASQTNYMTFTAGLTGVTPVISSTGVDGANVGIVLRGSGNAPTTLGSGTSATHVAGSLVLQNIPTSCSGQPADAVATVGGTLTLCP